MERLKSKRELEISLTGEAVRIPKARKETMEVNCKQLGDWVWASSESRTKHVVNPEKPWRRILKSAGVEHATLHDVRRTLGSRLAMDGVADTTIAKVLGHTSLKSLKHYAHLDITAGREAVDKVMSPLFEKPQQEIIVAAFAKNRG
jgi:integrase